MTPTLATALAAACIRIHAALRDLGDRPSVFQRSARAEHIGAVARVATTHLSASIPLPQGLTTEDPWIRLHTTYAPDSGAIAEACVVVVLCGAAFGSVSASIPVGPDVTPAAVLGVWNAAIIDAGKAEIEAHRARLRAIFGLVVFATQANPVTP